MVFNNANAKDHGVNIIYKLLFYSQNSVNKTLNYDRQKYSFSRHNKKLFRY